MRLFRYAVWAMCLCVAGAARAEPAFIVGISTHLMNYDAPPRPALELARETGVTAVKDDAFWSTAEIERGTLRIVPGWRTYLNDAESLSLQRLIILNHSTRFFDNAKPRGGAVKKAYLKYVDYVTRQLGNRVNYYEIWNEWDLEAPGDAKLAADYVALVRDTAPVIRKNTRAVAGTPAKILAGSVTPEGMNLGFADHMIAAGTLDLVDGLSVHPYAHCAANDGNNPESWVQWLRDYELHIREKAGRVVPIYLTEMAWPSHTGPCGNNPQTQAAYMARIFFFARTIPNIQGMWWYDLVNDGPDRHDQEHNFGLLNGDLSPKPAWHVLKAIAPFVRDYRYQPEGSVQADGRYLLRFDNRTQRVLVAWSGGEPRSERITDEAGKPGKLALIDTEQAQRGWVEQDSTWVCEASRCSADVTLGRFPKVIRLAPTPR